MKLTATQHAAIKWTSGRLEQAYAEHRAVMLEIGLSPDIAWRFTEDGEAIHDAPPQLTVVEPGEEASA